MNDLITPETDVYRPSAAINPERLEYLWSLATRLANTSLVPESLRKEGSGNSKTDLPIETVIGNVFAVCEQADRWNQSPFALLSCAAIVHGKLGFEGKVIAAVLEANFHIVLHHYFTGDATSEDCRIYLCDRELPPDLVDQLRPGIRIPGYRIMDGDVSTWKTTGNGSPWRPATYTKMLVYRGTREWSRIYKPAAIMGVLADDELFEIHMERAAQQARNVTPSLASRFGGPSADGFNAGNVTKQIDNGGAIAMDRIGNQAGDVVDAQSEPKAESSARRVSGDSKDDSAESSAKRQVNTTRAAIASFEEFSAALFRYGGTGNGIEADRNKAMQASDAFWDEQGGKPTHPADVTLCKKIIAAHAERMGSGENPDAVKKKISALIEQSINEL